METAESDDDTLEFEIEVVESSSSSISLASNLVTEATSIQLTCQNVVDQQTGIKEAPEEEKREIDNEKRVDSELCEDSREDFKEIGDTQEYESEKQPEPIDETIKKNTIICDVVEERLLSSHKMPPSLDSCENELPENQVQTSEGSVNEYHLIKGEQQVRKFGSQNENSGGGEISMDKSPQVDEKQEMINEVIPGTLEVGPSHPRDDAIDHRTDVTTISTLDTNTQAIPKDQKNHLEVAAEQSNLEPELPERDDKLETAEGNKLQEPQQEAENESAQNTESASNDVLCDQISASIEGPSGKAHETSTQSSLVSASLTMGESLHKLPVSIELMKAKSELVRENIYPNGTFAAIGSELINKLAANYTDELECVERYLKQQQEVDRKPSIFENDILLEEVGNSTIQQLQVDNEANTNRESLSESFGLSLDQIKLATQKRRVSYGGGISRSASNFSLTTCGEDLELEFDNEPAFERHQVEFKRNRDVRDEYELGEELGRGRFGTVCKCVEKGENGRKLAAKFVNMRRPEDRKDVEREVHIMSLLQHKRLLQLFDAFDDGKDEMCLITELIEGGELFERIVDDDFDLTEKKAAIFMRQICQGVEYMHSQQVVHLDMKPENILCVSKTGNKIKLIDFGLARELNSSEPLRVMFGTPDFAAPEVLAYDVVSFATDMWSVGVICYVLLSGLSPFMGDSDIETMANVTKATYDFEDKSFEPISDLAKDFISKLLVREQSKRLKPDECLQHPWLQRGGIQLEANIRSRRESMVVSMLHNSTSQTMLNANLEQLQQLNDNGDTLTPPILLSLDKRNLKKYVIRRKWHKTVHAIMALGRMGANLKF